MRLLLDTQVLLWTLAEPRRLDREARATIESGDTEVLFSAASIWEIAIKASLRRDDYAFDPAEIAQAALDTGFSELAVRISAAALVAQLPYCIATPSTVFSSRRRWPSPQPSTRPMRSSCLIRIWSGESARELRVRFIWPRQLIAPQRECRPPRPRSQGCYRSSLARPSRPAGARIRSWRDAGRRGS
jgi:PIN domain nuclease of toxin-antitoxin system